jgi:type I restriction enzyme R subunit
MGNNEQMIRADFDEAKASQLPFVELLLNLGYSYISTAEVLEERENNLSRFVLKKTAFTKLKELNAEVSDKNIKDAIDGLDNMPLEGIIDTSREVYNIIMHKGGKTVVDVVDGRNVSKSLQFIDFENIERNVFQVAVEYQVEGRGNIRPDIVLFVNGFPFVVVENKKSSVNIKEALHQMIRNQGIDYAPRFFTYPQLLIAANCDNFLYGNTGTPAKFYVSWKEKDADVEEIDKNILSLIERPIDEQVYVRVLADLNGATLGHKQVLERQVTTQDRGVYNVLRPERLLSIVKNFIIYDAGDKKSARYQQYFAIEKILERISQFRETKTGRKRKGGIIWHTQGSGKSLTMVMLVKALIEEPSIANPRIIVVTDRIDLDKQIATTFNNCNIKKDVITARTGRHLLDLIKEKNPNVITTLIHKFESAGKKEDFADLDENIFVLVDEAHRTQGGSANMEMNSIIPNACFIGFTGTPLMKNEKHVSAEKFGDYIDKYTIDDALADHVILPLIYEGRFIEMYQLSKEQMDVHVDDIKTDLDKGKQKFYQDKFSGQIIDQNPSKIEEVAKNIQKHFSENFSGTGLKGQVVAPSKHAAVLFQKYFGQNTKLNTAVVISDIGAGEDPEDDKKKEVVDFLTDVKHKYRDLKSYETNVVDSFKKDPSGVDLLIVVDKLLTGFDAPRNTVLYLAKDLRDHNLLQAIARVNRLFDNEKDKLPKTAGYIIDYSENAKNLDRAMKLFGNYEEEDVRGTLIDLNDKIGDLEKSYSAVAEYFKGIKNKEDQEEYIKRFEEEKERKDFYKSVNDLLRNLSECMMLEDFSKEFSNLDVYQKDIKKILEIQKNVRVRYTDLDDYSDYRRQLVKILDRYVDAREAEVLTLPIDLSDKESLNRMVATLNSDASRAAAIAAQTDKVIHDNWKSDPEYYDRFSKKVEEILRSMREKKMEDLEAFNQMKLLRDEMLDKKDDELPAGVEANSGKDIFYRNLRDYFVGKDLSDDAYVEIVKEVFEILKSEVKVDWQRNSEVKRQIMNKIDDYLYDIVRGVNGVDLSNEQMVKLNERIMELAVMNSEMF